MIGTMTLSQAAIAFGGTLLFPDCEFTGVSTDSRTLDEGQLFVALVGENFDGHDFLADAARKACGLVVSRADKSLALPQWVVEDTTKAFGQLALLNRRRFHGPVIGLTGSTGKTTVKEMLAAILSRLGPTLATVGNLNNHIGVPRTVLSLMEEHRFAVVEMGASGPGEIAYLCQIARPDVGLVTNVMAAHIEGFGSESEIADTKGAVFSSLGDDGVAVINRDDTWHAKWEVMAGERRVITFSLTDTAAGVFASEPEPTGGGTEFRLHIDGKSVTVSLPLPGKHNVANALAAAACACAVGIGMRDIAAGLADVKPVKGRLQTRAGLAGATVLDDSYNANPGSVRAAIDVLALRSGRRILVLGDMAELGSLSRTSHQDVGRYAREQGIDDLFVTGQFAEASGRGFGPEARVFDTREALTEALKEQLDADTTVLVKGSRSAAMDKVVARITREDKNASLAS